MTTIYQEQKEAVCAVSRSYLHFSLPLRNPPVLIISPLVTHKYTYESTENTQVKYNACLNYIQLTGSTEQTNGQSVT